MSLAKNTEAEKAIIGRWLMNPDSFTVESVGMSAETFTDARYRAAFAAMLDRSRTGQKWSLPVLAEELVKNKSIAGTVCGVLSDALMYGGQDGPDLAGINIGRLKELWAVRLAQTAQAETVAQWYPGMKVEELLEKSRETVGALEHAMHSDESSDSTVALRNIIMQVQAGKKQFGIRTGLHRFDDSVGGLMPGHLYIVGARPSAGKTAFAVTAATQAAKEGAIVQLFSTETTRAVLGARLISYRGNLDAFDIKKGEVDVGQLAEDAARVPRMDLFDDACSLSAVRARVMKCARANPRTPRVCIVDYIELMQAPKSMNREQEISQLISGLQSLAKEASCAMVVCSQLKREAEGREPSMKDLRMSGMLEQAADVILLLWVTGNADEEPVEIGMKMDKNKIGGVLYRQNGLVWKAHSKVRECDGTPSRRERSSRF